MMLKPAFGAVVAVGFAVSSAIAFPEPDYGCYMVNSQGRTVDLTSMCGKTSAVKSVSTVSGGFLKVATLADGRQVFLDYDETTAKSMILRMLDNSGQGLYSYHYNYACAERRAFLTKTEIYKNGRYVELESDKESKFESGSAISNALAASCRKIGSPGY